VLSPGVREQAAWPLEALQGSQAAITARNLHLGTRMNVSIPEEPMDPNHGAPSGMHNRNLGQPNLKRFAWCSSVLCFCTKRITHIKIPPRTPHFNLDLSLQHEGRDMSWPVQHMIMLLAIALGPLGGDQADSNQSASLSQASRL